MDNVEVEILQEHTEPLHVMTTFLTTYLFILDLTKSAMHQIKNCRHIHYFLALAAHKIQGGARVVLLGINKFKLIGRQEDIEDEVDEFFEQARQEFDQNFRHQFVDQHHAISSDICSQEGVEEIKNLIKDIQENRQSEEIPRHFLQLEDELRKIKQKVITVEEVWSIINNTNFQIKGHQELIAFLETLTKAGQLIFLNGIETNNFVILDRQWFINAALSIININKRHRENPSLRQYVQKLLQTGKLENDLLKAVWTFDKENMFWENREILLIYLKSYYLLFNINYNHSNGIEGEGRSILFAPSFLRQNQDLKNGDIYYVFRNEFKSLPLFYVNNGNIFPPKLFNEIISKLQEMFPVYQRFDKTMLFSDVGVFHIGNDLLGIIRLKHNAIELRVVNMSDYLTDTKLCKLFNNIVKYVLDKHTQECHSTCYFKQAIGCHNGNVCIYLDELYSRGELRCPAKGEKHFHDIITVENQWFSERSYQVEVQDRAIAQLASQAIGYQWCYLGELLGIQDLSYRNSENGSMCTSHKIFKMLKRWRNESGEKATWEELLDKIKMTCSFDMEQVHNVYNGFSY